MWCAAWLAVHLTCFFVLGRSMAMRWAFSGRLIPTSKRRELWTSEEAYYHTKVTRWCWSVCEQEGVRLDRRLPAIELDWGCQGTGGYSLEAVLRWQVLVHWGSCKSAADPRQRASLGGPSSPPPTSWPLVEVGGHKEENWTEARLILCRWVLISKIKSS